MGFLVFIALVVAVVVAYRMRVQILSKVLGQSETRVRAQLEQRKRR